MATITEDYISFEVAKLLKEKGFKEWCNCAYGTSVRHNGEEIDEDEEYELKAEGKASEIEYIEGGHLYRMNYDNITKFAGLYACPSQSVAMKWLREVHNIFIDIRFNRTYQRYKYFVFFMGTNDDDMYDHTNLSKKESYEETVEAAIKYCLTNLI